jgi:hypothetical protein
MSEGTEACLDWMELKLVLAVLLRDWRTGLIPDQNIRLPTPLHPCFATEFLAAANKADDDDPIGALGE